jgi:hypothetical protein
VSKKRTILSKFFNLSASDKKLYFEALYVSMLVKLIVTLVPLRWYARHLGTQHAISPEVEQESDFHLIFRVGQAIVRSRKTTPWPTRCFTDAITAKIMLRRRGLASTLYLGVDKKNEKMTAHAWLRCGTLIVTGKKEMKKFTVVSSFA